LVAGAHLLAGLSVQQLYEKVVVEDVGAGWNVVYEWNHRRRLLVYMLRTKPSFCRVCYNRVYGDVLRLVSVVRSSLLFCYLGPGSPSYVLWF